MNDYRLHLIHISECISRIEEYVGGRNREQFLGSTMVQDAVVRNLQVLAESTQRLPDTVKSAHPEVQWREIAGFRNVLVHDYLGLNVERVWEVIQNDLPDLKRKIDAMLRDG